LNDGQFPGDFNWKLTTASKVSAEDMGFGAVVIRRDNGDVVFRGNQDYTADVNLPALLGQKEWIISDGHGNELRRVSVSGGEK
jgi:tRNA(Arg) A34 adenosine deaminase TadA